MREASLLLVFWQPPQVTAAQAGTAGASVAAERASTSFFTTSTARLKKSFAYGLMT